MPVSVTFQLNIQKGICKMLPNNDPIHVSSQYKAYKFCFYVYVSLYSKQEKENKCDKFIEGLRTKKKKNLIHKDTVWIIKTKTKRYRYIWNFTGMASTIQNLDLD